MRNINRIYLRLSIIPLICALVISAIILVFFRFLPEKLPLFYSLPWGDNQLVYHQQFLIVPISMSTIGILNFILSEQLHPSQSFFKNILIFSSLISSLILTITFIKIVSIFI